MTRYCLDTSALLDAWNRSYPPDVFPQLWQAIEEGVAAGRFVAAEEVRVEIAKKDDTLLKWAKKQRGLFVDLDAAQQAAVAEILDAFPKLIENRAHHISPVGHETRAAPPRAIQLPCRLPGQRVAGTLLIGASLAGRVRGLRGELEFHGRLAFVARDLSYPGQRRHRVKQTPHTRGARCIHSALEGATQRVQFRRGEGLESGEVRNLPQILTQQLVQQS